MSTAVQVQYRRGTSTQVAAFTGAAGEMVVDTTNNRVVVQDGATAGGFAASKLGELAAPSPNGASAQFAYVEQLITCAGATTSIPLGVTGVILALSLRVVTAVTGCTSITINDSQNGNGHWGSGIAVSAGTTNAGAAIPGPYYNSSTTLALAAVGGGASFTGGTVRVSALMMIPTPPQS